MSLLSKKEIVLESKKYQKTGKTYVPQMCTVLKNEKFILRSLKNISWIQSYSTLGTLETMLSREVKLQTKQDKL